MKTSTLTTLLTLSSTSLSACSRSACSRQGSVSLTFYGYPDNDPPSAQTAYNCGGRNNIAGGSGTYDDPLTMASAKGEFSKCEIVYVPYLQKYVRCMFAPPPPVYVLLSLGEEMRMFTEVENRRRLLPTMYRRLQLREAAHRYLDWLVDRKRWKRANRLREQAHSERQHRYSP